MKGIWDLLKKVADAATEVIDSIPDMDEEIAEYMPSDMYAEFRLREKIDEIKRFLALEPDEKTVSLYGNCPAIAQHQYEKRPGPNAAYDEAFFECYKKYCGRMALMSAERRANGLLDAYYQRNKIRDSLRRFIEHINDIEPEDDPQLMARVGYNNHISYLKMQLDEALAQYDNYVGAAYADDQTPDAVSRRVCEFIRIECQMISCLCQLPKARELMEKPDVYQNKEKNSELSTIYDLFAVRSHHMDEIQALSARLDEVTEKYKQAIRRADVLRQNLRDVLTDEWFAALNPENAANGVSEMTAQELKAYCSRMLIPVQEKLLSIN